MPQDSLRRQLRRHSVALISLVVALLSLSYNTWRNEQTEANRNVRTAGIELLLKLGELEQVVFFRHYEKDELRGSPRAGWAYVLTIKDLSTLTGEPATSSATGLYQTWGRDWSGLGADNASQERISADIEQLRTDTLAVLAELE